MWVHLPACEGMKARDQYTCVWVHLPVCEGMEAWDQYTRVWVHLHVCEDMKARDQYWVPFFDHSPHFDLKFKNLVGWLANKFQGSAYSCMASPSFLWGSCGLNSGLLASTKVT